MQGILTQGAGGCTGQLHESDSGRAGETGKPDHHRYQSSSLWKPDPECARNSVQYEERNQRDKTTPVSRACQFDHVGLTYAAGGNRISDGY